MGRGRDTVRNKVYEHFLACWDSKGAAQTAMDDFQVAMEYYLDRSRVRNFKRLMEDTNMRRFYFYSNMKEIFKVQFFEYVYFTFRWKERERVKI